jgi:hypothetical protein
MISFLKSMMGLGVSREAKLTSSYFTESASALSKAGGGTESDILSVLRGDKALADVGLENTSSAKVIGQIKEDFDQGTMRTTDSVSAMFRNVEDTDELFGGLSAAGQTRAQALGFSAFGNPGNILGSMGMGAAFGAGASSMFGGDVKEGAVYGGLAGGVGAVGAKMFRAGLQDLEESVMKKALGKDFATENILGTKFLSGGGVARGERAYMDSGEIIKNNRVVETLDPETMNTLQRQKMLKPGYAPINKGRTVETGSEVSARSQNLQAISAQDFKPAEKLNVAESFALKKMQDTKSASMGVQSRFATMGGAMLAGVAFSGKAGEDKRRGFNKNRGNRF